MGELSKILQGLGLKTESPPLGHSIGGASVVGGSVFGASIGGTSVYGNIRTVSPR